jgi:hypothetical protein
MTLISEMLESGNAGAVNGAAVPPYWASAEDKIQRGELNTTARIMVDFIAGFQAKADYCQSLQ